MKKMKKTYFADKKASYNNEQARVLGEIIESLGDQFKTEDLVEKARPKNSPIHRLFQWDDAIAGHKYRLYQAQYHIRHLRVKVENVDASTRAVHNFRVKSESIHAPVEVVVSSDKLRQLTVDKAWRELMAWKARYIEYQDVFGEILKLIDKAQSKAAKDVA